MRFDDFTKWYESLPDYNRPKTVWVCDFRYRSYDQTRALRKIKPIEVNIHYSPQPVDGYRRYSYSGCDYEFSTVGKNKVIMPYDNCSYGKSALEVFTDEKECIFEYARMLDEAIRGFDAYKQKEIETIDTRVSKIREELESL